MSPVQVGSDTSWKELSRFAANQILCRELMKNALLLLIQPVKRNWREVTREYDQGRWKTVLQEREWECYGRLEDYVLRGDSQEIIAKIDGRFVRGSSKEYYNHRARILARVISEFVGHDTELVELGCGPGTNLFSLLLDRSWDYLVGLDISENALTVSRSVSDHFKLSAKMHFAQLDLTEVHHKGYERVKGRMVFSYYCLEQLKYVTRQVVQSLIDAGVKRVIHIEPTIELLNLSSLKDLVTYLYIKRKDYQDNLLHTLQGFVKTGAIRILETRRLYYAPTVKHDPTLIVWEPARL